MKFSTQFLFTTLSKTTKQVSVFALSIILARYFTKADYGTYLHVQLISNIAIWSFLLGIPHSVYYFIPKTYEKRRFVLTTLVMTIAIAIVVSVLVMINIEQLASLLANPSILSMALILGGMTLFQIPLSVFEPLMIATNKVKVFVQFDFAFSLGFFAVIVTPVTMGYSVAEVLYCLVAFQGLQFSVTLIICLLTALALKNEKSNATLSPKVSENSSNSNEFQNLLTPYKIKEQFKYSLPIGGSLAVAETSKYADKIIVSNQFTPDDYAIYARGAMDIPVISVIANTLDNLLMPKFIKAYNDNNTAELIHVWHSAMRMMAVFIYPACLFLVFIGPQLIPALFSQKYASSSIIFQIYTLGLLTQISTFNVIYRAIGKTQVMLWLAIIFLLCNIVITWLCIRLWGVNGAAGAVVILTFLYQTTSLTIITKYLNIKISQVLPWKSLLLTLLTSAISIIPIWFVSLLNLPAWPLMILMSVVYGVFYLVLLRFSSALSQSEKDSLRVILPSKLKWIF